MLDKVRELDILDMTPMEAMNILYELHKKDKKLTAMGVKEYGENYLVR